MYIIEDNCGLPQCGNYETYSFTEFWELEEFLDDNPDIMERIRDQYAIIIEE